MKFEYKPSFDRTFKKLEQIQKKQVSEAIFSLIDFFDTGKKPNGLGLKNLRKDFWEIRCSKGIRVLFKFEDDKISFIIVGNHNDIKNYLKRI